VIRLQGISLDIRGSQAAAIDYYNYSLEIFKEIRDKMGIDTSLNNIGVIYLNQGKTDKALEYYVQSLAIKKEIGDKNGIANSFNNIGTIYYNNGKFDQAVDFYNQSLTISKEIGDKYGIAYSLNCIGLIFIHQNKFDQAMDYCSQSFSLAQEIGNVERIKVAAAALKKIYKSQNQGMKALEMFELEVQMSDSLKSEEITKQIAQAESRAEFEKHQLIKEQDAKETARIEAEKIARRNSIQYSGIGFGLFAIFGLVFFLGRIQLPKWAVELSVFLPFLIFFEFLLVITDPYVDAWSEGVPLIKLGINVVMAAAIFPLHSFFESFLKNRLFQSK
jgi:tetratricopeptide (TPR) repeat protein